MIGLITGQVAHLSAPVVCILTASGIGYEIELPVPAFCHLQLNEEAQIWTHLHVREDAQLLYGFANHQDRGVFRQLIKINGVGAKMALAMLSNMSVAELKQCVDNDDEMALVRIPGIGKKTAQRLLIELKDKLKNIQTDTLPLDSSAIEQATGQHTPQSLNIKMQQIISEVEAALTSLGYKSKEAQQAIKLAQTHLNLSMDKEAASHDWLNEADNQKTLQQLLKTSLQQLAK